MSQESTFCSLPFNSFYTYNTGTVRICCDSDIVGKIEGESLNFESVWNGEKWKEIRKSFLNNEKHPACIKCWKKEERDEISTRENRDREKLLALTDSDGTISVGPEELHIRLGNECNLKCIICTPHNSTKWYAEADIYKKYVDDNFGNEIKAELLQSSWTKKSFSNAKIILFAGGEPFLIPQHEEVLDYLIDKNLSENIELNYYTNGTIVPSKFVEKFKKFYKIKINISIDAVGDEFDYIRYPAKWDTVQLNLLEIDKLSLDNLEWRIVTVLFNLSALNIEKLFEWRDSVKWENKPEIVLQDLTEPSFFNVRTFETNRKEVIVDKLNKISKSSSSKYERLKIQAAIENVLEPSNISEDKAITNLSNFLSELDAKKSTNFKEVFPVINNLISKN